MQAYRIETTVEADGTLKLGAVPFPAGQRVEVIVLPAPAETTGGATRCAGYRTDTTVRPTRSPRRTGKRSGDPARYTHSPCRCP
jgi:hypothetical protein